MEATRLKAARSQLWRAWIFGGLLWSVVFLCAAAVIASLLGVERGTELFAIVFGAMVLALGTFAIMRFGALAWIVGRRLWKRQPIMEQE